MTANVSLEKRIVDIEQKILKVFVEGAWLEVNEGTQLGKGILFFNPVDVI